MKPDFQIKKVKLYNCDNKDFMREIPDNFYDLAIVDPPYGIGASNSNFIRKGKQTGKSKCVSGEKYTPKQWDNAVPNDDFFNELKRVSKNQIIWGVNYFNNLSGGRIVWDKDNGENLYSDCELAYQSITNGIRKVKIRWHGMLQQNMMEKEKRIHPTQKPVGLYKWCLTKYAKTGNKIIDTHGGSCSIGCACLDMDFDIDICEIDKEYFDKAVMRLKNNVQDYFAFV